MDIDNEPLPGEDEPEPPDTNIQHGVPVPEAADVDDVGDDEHFSPTQTTDQDLDNGMGPEAERLSQPEEHASDTEDAADEADDVPMSVVSTRTPTTVLARQTPASSTVGLLPQRLSLIHI